MNELPVLENSQIHAPKGSNLLFLGAYAGVTKRETNIIETVRPIVKSSSDFVVAFEKTGNMIAATPTEGEIYSFGEVVRVWPVKGGYAFSKLDPPIWIDPPL